MTKIACLPIAGIENPYQYLMMEGLKKNPSFEVSHGQPGKFFAIVRTAIIDKPDFIHIDWLHQYYARRSHWMTWLQFPFFVFELWFTKIVLKTKLVWTLHNITPHDLPYFGPYIWTRRIFAKHTKWIRVFSNRTIYHASQELRVGSNKFKVIPEGSYIGYYPNKISKIESRRIFGLKLNEFVLLFFGSIRPYKGIEKLIKDFLENKNQSWKLIIAGPARDLSYRNKIKELSNHPDIILIPKMVPISEVQNYMNVSDIVILPFEKIENSGSAILAMSFKKAILAPKKGVLPDRLVNQIDLLYTEEKGFLAHLKDLSIKQLNLIGEKNFKQLLKYKWEDFAKAFN